MAKKPRTRQVTLSIESGTFTGIFRRLRGEKREFDFSDIGMFRQLLSNERARLLKAIKNKNPGSIYQLAKIVGRDFKSVRQDVKLLEHFGFVELDASAKGKRDTLKPLLAIDKLIITIEV